MPTTQGQLLPFAREIVDISVSEELGESFLAYSLSVITARAIPDVRDGMKPVQRRILHAMAGMGMRPDRPHRKCAGVVGETMGKYHPHGDGAIYDALVRMGQDFSRNITLVDPHGNFGSLDDPPAAYRYTECRLTEAALEMIGEIDEDTVEFRATFDGERKEPIYLPGRLPNLLVNGTSGIAVGMATNMPCHNLGEVYDAIALVMQKRRPKPTVAELMEVLPGPDFPSGGIVIDDGLAEAYATGRGSFRIRAKCHIEQVAKTRRHIIEVTELPYLVGPERVVSRIQELMAAGRLMGIHDLKNLTDRKSGLRIHIELKPGINPQAMLTELYRQTPLEESFGINNVVLVDGAPTTVGLWELCDHYIQHRLDVVLRRTRHRLLKAQDRMHLVAGFLIALDAIDLVVSIIRTSDDSAEARQRLMDELSLSQTQAEAILELRLRRLTALARMELEAEAQELAGLIEGYEKILGSEQRRRTIVLDELKDLVERFGRHRHTTIVRPDELEDVTFDDVVPDDEEDDEPCAIALSTTGRVGREPVEGPKRQAFGVHDVLAHRLETSTHSRVWAVTSAGRALATPAAAVAEVSGRSRGTDVSEVFDTARGEQVLTLLTAGSVDQPIVLVTANGVVKRITVQEVAGTKPGGTVISLRGNDTVVAAFAAPDGTELVLVSSNAQALRTPADGISVQGRAAAGVAGMKLADGAKVVGAGPAADDGIVLTVTDRQTAKVTDVSEVPTKGRGAGGVRITRFRDERRLDYAYVGPGDGVVVAVGAADAPAKPDDPQPLTIPHTARDLVSKATTRRIHAAGTGRW